MNLAGQTADCKEASSVPNHLEMPMNNSVVELLAKDLNRQGGVFCPSPKADMKIWNSHPKVYLDLAHTGEARCPYCSTVYKLKAGEHFAGH